MAGTREGTTGLDWSDFNTDFHSSLPDIKSKQMKDNIHMSGGKMIDLRPYMLSRPHTVFENDQMQKCLDIFRLMNLRHLPVLAEDTGEIVGIITR